MFSLTWICKQPQGGGGRWFLSDRCVTPHIQRSSSYNTQKHPKNTIFNKTSKWSILASLHWVCLLSLIHFDALTGYSVTLWQYSNSFKNLRYQMIFFKTHLDKIQKNSNFSSGYIPLFSENIFFDIFSRPFLHYISRAILTVIFLRHKLEKRLRSVYIILKDYTSSKV